MFRENNVPFWNKEPSDITSNEVNSYKQIYRQLQKEPNHSLHG